MIQPLYFVQNKQMFAPLNMDQFRFRFKSAKQRAFKISKFSTDSTTTCFGRNVSYSGKQNIFFCAITELFWQYQFIFLFETCTM